MSFADDGSLDLTPSIRGAKAIKRKDGNSKQSSDRTTQTAAATDAAGGGVAKEDLGFFTALGRALAMAVVSRTFVKVNLSPALCKLILGRPVHFMDLLNSNQELFRDLLKVYCPESTVKFCWPFPSYSYWLEHPLCDCTLLLWSF